MSARLDVDAVEVLLLDADGTLFGSEEPAFAASAEVTNAFLSAHGIGRRFDAGALRRWAVGRNFRGTTRALLEEAGVDGDDGSLESWVARERRDVMAHLARVLRPDEDVLAALRALAGRYRLAVVSSSALARLGACFTATRLDDLLPAEVRFSAEDSLPNPVSKPDPAVYAHAGRELGVVGAAGLAVEDAAVGVRSAVEAGFPCLGLLHFVPEDERERRERELRDAGAVEVLPSWAALVERLAASAGSGRA